MEVFKDLSLIIKPAAFARVPEVLERHATLDWRRDLEREHKLERMDSASSEDRLLCFVHPESRGLTAAALWIAQSRVDSLWYVSNIVAVTNGQLTHSEYNALVDDFVNAVAEPAMAELGGSLEVSSGRESLDTWMTPEVAKLLVRFSRIANKSTGSSHPSDADRWRAFLIAAHRSRSTLDASRLVRWLIEDEGWPGDQAHGLAVEYEDGRNLLLSYDDVSERGS